MLSMMKLCELIRILMMLAYRKYRKYEPKIDGMFIIMLFSLIYKTLYIALIV